MLLCFMQSGIRTCWYCDIEKDQDERNHLFSVIVGCRTLSLKVASHANKQGLTHGTYEIRDILIYLCLNGKKDHEDGRHTCTKD